MIKPKIIFSRCFFEPVRYNGGIVIDDFIEKFKNHVECVFICPEVEIGLGIPRPHLILIQNNEKRLIQPETGTDLTGKMLQYVKNTVDNLNGIDGAVLKSKSPSCGVSSTKLYRDRRVIGKTDGFLAEELKKKFPSMPVEDEGRLRNKEIREHFLTRVFSFSELKALAKSLTIKELIEFHTRYKYLLMTYSQKYLKQLGSIVADREISQDEKYLKYKELFFYAFRNKPSNKKHVNTLMHIFGHISEHLNSKEKQHFLKLLEKYRNRKIELKVLIELLRNFAYRLDNQYILIQKYLNPFPEELDV